MKSPPANVLFRFPALSLLASMLLAGCGQYGDLYLPDDTAAQQTVQDDIEQQEETEVTQPEDL